MKDQSQTELTGYIPLSVLKRQIIRIGDIDRVPPTPGIFDEPTYCFKVNQEWWAIISGMIEWLASAEAWRDAED
jgi:hypothetical protein